MTRATAGIPSSFLIQAVDTNGLYFTRGGSTFVAEVAYLDQFQRIDSADNADGLYSISYTLTTSGQHAMTVQLGGASISSSPFFITVLPAVTSAAHSGLFGEGFCVGTAGVVGTFLLQARDQFLNGQVYRPSDIPLFNVQFSGPQDKQAAIQDLRDSTYIASYTLTRSGTYSLRISVVGNDQVSRVFVLRTAKAVANNSNIDPASLANLVAGLRTRVPILVRDKFHNLVPAPNTSDPLTSVSCALNGLDPIPVLSSSTQFVLYVQITAAGQYTLDVRVASAAILRSPYTAVIGHDVLNPRSSLATGSGVMGSQVETNSPILVTPRDRYGNLYKGIHTSDLIVTFSDVSKEFVSLIDLAPPSELLVTYSVVFPCLQCSITIALQGSDISGSPFTLDIAPGDPPRMVSAIFASHLGSADVTFDVNTDRGGGALTGQFPCIALLDTATVTLAGGSNSNCYWNADNTFTLVFGSAHSLLPGSPISIRPGVVRAKLQNTEYARGFVPLQVPQDMVLPTPIISGPSRISSCDTLLLDASSTYASGGRDLEFSWGVFIGPPNRDDVLRFLQSLPSTQGTLELPDNTLLPGEIYTFTLSVMDFVGQRQTANFLVSTTQDTIPMLYLVGPEFQQIRRAVSHRLKARASVSDCGFEFEVKFTWTQVGGTPIGSWPYPNTATSSCVPFPAQFFEAGVEYAFSVSAATTVAASTDQVSFFVIPTDLVAVITGGDRSVPASQSVTLDASGTFDPDSSAAPFFFTWSCAPAPCFDDTAGLLSQDTPILIIPGGTFGVGSTKTFTVVVTKDPGPRSSTASVIITFVADGTSLVSLTMIGEPTPKVNPDERLVLEGIVESSASSVMTATSTCSPQYLWSMVSGDVNLGDLSTRSTSLRSPFLVLKSNALTPGQEYVLQLSGSCLPEAQSTARIKLVVNRPPLGGSFSITPRRGFALQTSYKLRASKWVDDPSDLPLMYRFSEQTGSTTKPLTGKIIENVISVVLTAPSVITANISYPLTTLQCDVCDFLGSCAQPLLDSVEVRAVEITDPEQFFLSLTQRSQGIGDVERTVGLVRAVAQTLNAQRGKGNTGRRLLQASNSTASQELRTRNLMIESLGNITDVVFVTPDYVTLVSSSLDPLMNAATPAVERFQTEGIVLLRHLVESSLSTGLESNTGSTISEALSGAAVSANSSHGTNISIETMDSIFLVITQLGHAQLFGRVPYETPETVKSSNLELTMGRFANLQLGEASLAPTECTASTCHTAILPASLPLLPLIFDAHMLSWGGVDRYSVDREVSVANVTTVQIFDGTSELNVSNLSTPLTVVLPIQQASRALTTRRDSDLVPICQYWDLRTKTWESRGCLAAGNATDFLYCQCFHLTDFGGLVRATFGSFDRFDLPLSSPGDLVASLPHDFLILVIVCMVLAGAGILALAGYWMDVRSLRKYRPPFLPSLFRQGYLFAATSGRFQIRFSSLFANLWSNRTAHLMRKHHSILGIAWRQPKDAFDRAERVTCLFLYIAIAMMVNILWFGHAGFPDQEMVGAGVLSAFLLIPVYPLCTLFFRHVEPSITSKRRKDEKKKKKKEDKRPPSSGRKRAARVEVVSSVEAFESGQESPIVISDPAYRVSRPAEIPIQHAQMPGEMDPAAGVVERQGPRPPEAESIRPTTIQRVHSRGTVEAVQSEYARPADIPAVRPAFGLEDIREELDDVDASTAKARRKRNRRSKEPKLLPRWFAYIAYAVTFCMFGMAIVVATVYGSTFLGITQFAWGIATITTLLLQFILVEPIIICLRAFIEVRARLLQAIAAKPYASEEEEEEGPEQEDQASLQAPDSPGRYQSRDARATFNIPGSPQGLVPEVMGLHLPQIVDLLLLNFKDGVIGLRDFSELLTDFGVEADDPRLQEYWDTIPLNNNREADWKQMLCECAKKELDKVLLGIFLDLEHAEHRCKIAEFADVLKNMMAEPHIHMLVSEADGDDDGLITFEQLRSAVENLIEELRGDEDVNRFLEDDQAAAVQSSEVESRVLRQLTAAKSKQQLSKARSPPRSRAMTAEDSDVQVLDM